MTAFLIGMYVDLFMTMDMLFKSTENYKDNLILNMTTENETKIHNLEETGLPDSTSTWRKAPMKTIDPVRWQKIGSGCWWLYSVMRNSWQHSQVLQIG